MSSAKRAINDRPSPPFCAYQKHGAAFYAILFTVFFAIVERCYPKFLLFLAFFRLVSKAVSTLRYETSVRFLAYGLICGGTETGGGRREH